MKREVIEQEAVPEAYHTKYRPRSFKMVRGQDKAVGILESTIRKGTSQAFILLGPSGCGKTTLARIAAKHAGCDHMDIVEVDAATYSGAEDTRKLQEVMTYRALGSTGKRAIIIDECHRLSQTAWDTLLKSVEEPGRHALWFFCTTNPTKVPKTVATRCTKVELDLVDDKEIEAVVQRVIAKEGLEVDQGVVNVIVAMANGSPRQALVNLAAAEDAGSRKEAAKILSFTLDSDPIRELCQFLLKGGSWVKAMGIINLFPVDDKNYEGRRIVVCAYMGAVLRGAKSDDAATKTLQILEAWSTPYNSAEGIAPFMLSIGRTLYAE